MIGMKSIILLDYRKIGLGKLSFNILVCCYVTVSVFPKDESSYKEPFVGHELCSSFNSLNL